MDIVSHVAQRDSRAWQRTNSRAAVHAARSTPGEGVGCRRAHWEVRQCRLKREERRSQAPSGSPGREYRARVPQDIDCEVVSGQATAIPAPPAASRPGPRKQKAGAVSGPADGVASSFGVLVPYGTRTPHAFQRGAMTAGD